MSSKGLAKAKELRKRGGEGGAAAPAAKRQKITAVVQSNRSLLLNTQPEILRKVYSFLSLKEALPLCQVHRQFNEAPNDIYQYSFIMQEGTLKNLGFDQNYCTQYLMNQSRVLANPIDIENLRAVLRNETLPSID